MKLAQSNLKRIGGRRILHNKSLTYGEILHTSRKYPIIKLAFLAKFSMKNSAGTSSIKFTTIRITGSINIVSNCFHRLRAVENSLWDL
jgi:hypothetical protein